MLIPQYNTAATLQMLNSIVPITRFNKGEAGKIIEEVKQDGVRIIVKNNVPECVLITVDEYNRLTEIANRSVTLNITKEDEEKRKAFIKKIRKNVQPPMPPRMTVKEALQKYGSKPIDIDEEAIYELRRISAL